MPTDPICALRERLSRLQAPTQYAPACYGEAEDLEAQVRQQHGRRAAEMEGWLRQAEERASRPDVDAAALEQLRPVLERLRSQIEDRRRMARGEQPQTQYAGADEGTVNDFLTQLQSPEHDATRWGHPEGDHTFRQVAADALSDNGREEEAEHLRTPGRHVMVHQGRVVPGRWDASAAMPYLQDAWNHVEEFGGWAVPHLPEDVGGQEVDHEWHDSAHHGDDLPPTDAQGRPLSHYPPGTVRLPQDDAPIRHVHASALPGHLADELERDNALFHPPQPEWGDTLYRLRHAQVEFPANEHGLPVVNPEDVDPDTGEDLWADYASPDSFTVYADDYPLDDPYPDDALELPEADGRSDDGHAARMRDRYGDDWGRGPSPHDQRHRRQYPARQDYADDRNGYFVPDHEIEPFLRPIYAEWGGGVGGGSVHDFWNDWLGRTAHHLGALGDYMAERGDPRAALVHASLHAKLADPRNGHQQAAWAGHNGHDYELTANPLTGQTSLGWWPPDGDMVGQIGAFTPDEARDLIDRMPAQVRDKFHAHLDKHLGPRPQPQQEPEQYARQDYAYGPAGADPCALRGRLDALKGKLCGPTEYGTGEDLLAGVRDNPDDHNARLVAADWMQENNRPHEEAVLRDLARPVHVHPQGWAVAPGPAPAVLPPPVNTGFGQWANRGPRVSPKVIRDQNMHSFLRVLGQRRFPEGWTPPQAGTGAFNPPPQPLPQRDRGERYAATPYRYPTDDYGNITGIMTPVSKGTFLGGKWGPKPKVRGVGYARDGGRTDYGMVDVTNFADEANEAWKQAVNHAADHDLGAVHVSAAYRGSDIHGILADHLADHGDPREALARNGLDYFAAQDRVGEHFGALRHDPETGIHRTIQQPPGVALPDGSSLQAMVHSIRGRPRPEMIHVQWAPRGFQNYYHGVFTPDEYEQWASAFDEPHASEIRTMGTPRTNYSRTAYGDREDLEAFFHHVNAPWASHGEQDAAARSGLADWLAERGRDDEANWAADLSYPVGVSHGKVGPGATPQLDNSSHRYLAGLRSGAHGGHLPHPDTVASAHNTMKGFLDAAGDVHEGADPARASGREFYLPNDFRRARNRQGGGFLASAGVAGSTLFHPDTARRLNALSRRFGRHTVQPHLIGDKMQLISEGGFHTPMPDDPDPDYEIDHGYANPDGPTNYDDSQDFETFANHVRANQQDRGAREAFSDWLRDRGRDEEADHLTRPPAQKLAPSHAHLGPYQLVGFHKGRVGPGHVTGLDWFGRNYLGEALDTETTEVDEPGNYQPLGEYYGGNDFHPDAVAAIHHTTNEFRRRAGDLLEGDDGHGWGPSHFYLSRNGHGTGFFDHDLYWGPEEAEQLQEHAAAMGEHRFYVGDDGMIHSHEEGHYDAGSAPTAYSATMYDPADDFHAMLSAPEHAATRHGTGEYWPAYEQALRDLENTPVEEPDHEDYSAGYAPTAYADDDQYEPAGAERWVRDEMPSELPPPPPAPPPPDYRPHLMPDPDDPARIALDHTIPAALKLSGDMMGAARSAGSHPTRGWHFGGFPYEATQAYEHAVAAHRAWGEGDFDAARFGHFRAASAHNGLVEPRYGPNSDPYYRENPPEDFAGAERWHPDHRNLEARNHAAHKDAYHANLLASLHVPEGGPKAQVAQFLHHYYRTGDSSSLHAMADYLQESGADGLGAAAAGALAGDDHRRAADIGHHTLFMPHLWQDDEF